MIHNILLDIDDLDEYKISYTEIKNNIKDILKYLKNT